MPFLKEGKRMKIPIFRDPHVGIGIGILTYFRAVGEGSRRVIPQFFENSLIFPELYPPKRQNSGHLRLFAPPPPLLHRPLSF